jgi:photosystem II stability/assembly factor-like uncharacterized protein
MLFGPAFFLRLRIRCNANVVLTVLITSLAIASPVSGQRWERVGPPGGMVMSLAAAPDGTIYLGAPDGHVFASGDQGRHWELRGRAGARLDGVVQRILADSRNAKRLLVAIWFRGVQGGGVFESVDEARTWKLAGLGDEAVRALEQSISDPTVWIAGTRSGVFRSTDNTKTWQRITRADDPELQNIDSLAIDPREAQTIYVGTYHLPWKTTNGGKTWHAISEGMIDDSDIMSLRIDANDPRRIFASACSGIYRSENRGANWTKLQGIPYSSRRTQQIVQDPQDSQTLYAATTEGLWMTEDYGETWRRITSRDSDTNAVVVLPGRTEKVILPGTSAQGILRSVDGGNSFVASNEGFSHRVIAVLAVNAQRPRELLARAEELGGKVLASDDGGRTWTELSAKPPQRSIERVFWSRAGYWAAFSGGGLGRLDSNAQAWRIVWFREPVAAATARRRIGRRPKIPTAVLRVNRLVEEGGKTFAATDNGLWQLDEDRMEFRRVAAKNLPPTVSYLSATQAGSLLAIAGGELWANGSGREWRQIASQAASRAGLLWVTENPHAPGEWLLGTEHGVFQGAPGGEWRLMASGLPAIGSVAPAFSGSRCLLAMSNGGLYESRDALHTWVRIDTDAERGRINQIFTVGRGFVVGSEQEGILLRTDGDSQ